MADTPPAPKIELSPELKKLAAEELALLKKADDERIDKLLSDYTNINKRAAEGKPVGAHDFNQAEYDYNSAISYLFKSDQAVGSLLKEVKKASEKQFAHEVEERQKNHQPIDLEGIQKEITEAYDAAAAYTRSKAMATISDEAGKPVKEVPIPYELDNTALNKAFEKQYLEHPEQVKNVDIDKDIKTPAELLDWTLDHNHGAALVLKHTAGGSYKAITELLPELKAHGLHTIYIEGDESFQKMSELSAKDLHTLAKDGQVGSLKLFTQQELEQFYHEGASGNEPKEFVEMLARAKELNIRLRNHDKKGEIRADELDLVPGHRVPSSNFQWSEAVVQDRSEQKDPGAFLLLGGMSHLTGNPDHPEREIGLVARRLGIPVLSFTKSAEGAHGFHASHSPNGADFYLDGGKDYPALEQDALKQDALDGGFVPSATPKPASPSPHKKTKGK